MKQMTLTNEQIATNRLLALAPLSAQSGIPADVLVTLPGSGIAAIAADVRKRAMWAFYREHPEANKAAKKKWQQANPGAMQAAAKRWREANPEKVKAYQAKYRAVQKAKKAQLAGEAI